MATPEVISEVVERNVDTVPPPWEDLGERNNPSVVNAKKYVSLLREPTDPLSPGPKFGPWGEEQSSSTIDTNPADWVTPGVRLHSRSKSPAKHTRSPERYSYMSPSAAKGKQDVEFDPYAEGYVTDVDMLPLFRLLDPSGLSGCPRKAAHARAEAFKFIRSERQGRLTALEQVGKLTTQMTKLKEAAKKANGLKAKSDKVIKDAQDEAATRIGAAEASERIMKAKLAAMEGHLVSVKGQLEGIRELNNKLQQSLIQEREIAAEKSAELDRITKHKLSLLEEEAASLRRQLEDMRNENIRLHEALVQEQSTIELMKADQAQQQQQQQSQQQLMYAHSVPRSSGTMSPVMSLSPIVSTPDEERAVLNKLRTEMISLINAKECAERLVIAERVARQASEAALRDADVRERDLSIAKRRLEEELEELRREHDQTVAEWQEERAVIENSEHVRVEYEDEVEGEGEAEGGRSVYEDDGVDARTTASSVLSVKERDVRTHHHRQAEAEKQVSELMDLVVKLRGLVTEKDAHLESMTKALRQAQREQKRREADLCQQEEESRMLRREVAALEQHQSEMYEERYIEASQKLVAEERLQRQRAERSWQATEKQLRQEIRDLTKRCSVLQTKIDRMEYVAGAGTPYSPTRRGRSRSKSPTRTTSPKGDSSTASSTRLSSPSRYRRSVSPSRSLMEQRAGAHMLKECLPDLVGMHAKCFTEPMFRK